MTTKLRFSDLPEGITTFYQGGQTADLLGATNYPRAAEIVPDVDDSYAPMTVAWEIKTSGFLSDRQNLWYHSDCGQSGGFDVELPMNVRMLGNLVNPEWIDTNKPTGRFGLTVYDKPGTYTMTSTAKDVDGAEVTATHTFTVRDPRDYFDNIVYVDPDGDFTDVDGTDHSQDGSVICVENWGQIPRKRSGESFFINFRRGKDHVSGDDIQGYSGEFYMRDFGDPSLPKPNIIESIYCHGGSNPTKRITWHNLRGVRANRWNPHTESGWLETAYEKTKHFGSSVFSIQNIILYNCDTDGGHWAGRWEGPKTPSEYNPTITQAIIGGSLWNFRDFGFWGDGYRKVFYGVSVGRDVESFQGCIRKGSDVSYRYPETRDELGKDWSKTQSIHGPCRVSGLNPRGFFLCYLSDLFSNAGWSRAGDPLKESATRPAVQPCFRFNAQGVENVRSLFAKSIFEGGAPIVFHGLGGPSDCETTIENNLFIETERYGSGVLLTGGDSGYVMRNNIAVVPELVEFSCFLLSSNESYRDNFGNYKGRVYGNTIFIRGTEPRGADSSFTPAYASGQVQRQKGSDFGGYVPQERMFETEEHDNFIYAPFWDEPELEGFDKFLDLCVVARWPGQKWRNKWVERDLNEGVNYDPTDDDQVMDRSRENPVFFTHNGEDLPAVSAPISNLPAEGPNPLFWDFFGNRRPDQTVKGAVSADAQVNTSAPTFRLMPWLKLNNDGTVRYHSGSVAGGSASLVELSRDGTVIASSGDPDVGEIAHGGVAGMNELTMIVERSDGHRETVKLPWHQEA